MLNSDPESLSWVRICFAFVVVFGLITLLGLVLKYTQARGFILPRISGTSTRAKRLGMVESFALDVRRRLVIVRCDDEEHLLLLGVNQDIVIKTNLKGISTECTSAKNSL